MSTNAAQVRVDENEETGKLSIMDPPPSHADEDPESNTTMEEEDMDELDHDASPVSQENEGQNRKVIWPRYRPEGRVSILEYIKKTRAMDLITAEMFQRDDGEPVDPDDPRRHSVDLIAFLTALHDKTKSNQFVFTCYKKLPDPGVTWLSKMERKILLRRFAKPMDRRRGSARYYLQLVQDMIDAELPMNRWHWTTAIYFTAHKVPVLEKRDLQDAITLWRQMESMGINADGAIFELLFNIAIKANQFSVGDSLLREMENRGLSLSRHGMVAKIYACGRKRDLDGIQNGFDEFVRSGGIVDSTVLNALLSSLLQAGALEIAQQLYSKMMATYRTIHTKPQHLNDFSPSTFTEFGNWRKSASRLGGIFKRYMRLQNLYVENPEQVQDLVPMSPDTRTFYIVFSHHCLHTGDLGQICQILRDMESVFAVPPQSIIYNFLFLAFDRHKPSQGWTKERLQEVWVVFRRLIFESETRLSKLENEGVHIESRWENPLKSACNELLGPPEKNRYKPPRIRNNENERVDEENIMEKFDNMGRYRRSSYLDDSTPRQLENIMLLSRGMNIAILKAFGAHVGYRDLVEIYAQIERIWKPWKRLPSDAHAVKNELDRQLMRLRDNERSERLRPFSTRQKERYMS